MKLSDNLAVKVLIWLSIALSPIVLMKSCEKMRDKIMLAWDMTVEEHRKEIQRQLDCIQLNK